MTTMAGRGENRFSALGIMVDVLDITLDILSVAPGPGLIRFADPRNMRNPSRSG